jgi:hypothetical protein
MVSRPVRLHCLAMARFRGQRIVKERIEQPFDVFRIYARPGIGYGDQDTPTPDERGAHLERGRDR